MTTEPYVHPPLPWNPPKPRELPALRERLIDQMRNPFEHMAISQMIGMGLGTVVPFPRDPERSAAALLADEHRRLTAAHMYSVTADMTVFAVQAGERLPDWTIRSSDLPSTAGLMVFDEPIGAYVNNDSGRHSTVSIVAASWGPTAFASTDEGNLWLTFWGITDYTAHMEVLRDKGKMSREDARTLAYQQRAELSWDNEVVLPLDEDDIDFSITDRQVAQPLSKDEFEKTVVAQETTAPWAKTVRAAWLLMKQPKMTETTEEHLPRTMRRRMERLNLNTSPVRVIHLHSQRRRPQHAAEGHSHTVQYPVSGHWREQYYPSREAHDRIWIDEHIRGPEGAPFRVGKKYTVKVLNRPPRG